MTTIISDMDKHSGTTGVWKLFNTGGLFARLKKYLFNTGWLTAGKIFRMAAGMVVGIWVARYLGVEQFGVLSYCIAFALLFRPMAMFSLEGICVREIVKAPLEKNAILGSAFVLSLVAGILSFLAVVNLITVFRPDEPLYIAIVSIVGFGLIFFSFEVFDYWFQAKVNAKPVVVARTIVLLATSAFKVAGILLEAPVVFFAWVNLAELMLAGVALVIVYTRSGFKVTDLKVKFKWFKKLLHDAWPLALSGIAATVYLRIDKIMLGEMLGASEVGIYTAATRLAEAWYFLPIGIMTSLYPAVVKSIANRAADTNRRLQQVYNLMALLGYLVAIGTTLLATPVVTWLFGPDYQESAQVLTMYIWSGIFVNIAMGKAAWLKAMNHTKIQFVSTVSGAVINVALNLVLIKQYGVIGAAWATIISYSIEAYFILFLFPQTRKQARMITRALFVPVVRLKDIR